MSDPNKSSTNPLQDLWANIASWGGAPAATPNIQFQQQPMQAGPQSYLSATPSAGGVQYDTNSILANANANNNDPSFWAKAFTGYQNEAGNQVTPWAPATLSALSGLGQSWLGMQQLGLAQEQFDFKKEAFNKNWDNQTTLTNASQRDRQSARVAAAPGAYQSVGEYMQQNKVG